MPVINVLPFESPAQVTPEEIVAIAQALRAGAKVTITAPPAVATLLARMAEGWNRDPNSRMAVTVGDAYTGGNPAASVTRDFTFTLRPEHWMALLLQF